jgi:hypothetical protein
MKMNKLKAIVISLLGDSLKPLRRELAPLAWSGVVGVTVADDDVDVVPPGELPALVAAKVIVAAGPEVFSPESLGTLLPAALPADPMLAEPPLPLEVELAIAAPPLLVDPLLIAREVVGPEREGLLLSVWMRVHGQSVIVKVVG